jgi:hypothetical protein
MMGTNTELYEQDFYAWTQATADRIRRGKWHEVDPVCVAEELESLGKRDRRELGSRVEVLTMHLLKWCYQPERREHSHSWYDTIVEQRGQIQSLLEDSPSLRPQVTTLLVQHYERARRRAMGETQDCPWSAAQILDDGFWPERS